MKLERRHGLFGIALLGTLLTAVLLARGSVAATPKPAPHGDWEAVSYPALDRLIAQRAADARAKTASARQTPR